MKSLTFQNNDLRKILIRANNWIGDVVMSTPFLHCVRSAFPQAHIAVLAKPWVIPVLSSNPHIDEIVKFDSKGIHKGSRGILRLSRALKSDRFQAAILLQRAFQAALIAYLARVPIRAGYRTDARSSLLTHPVTPPRDNLLHRVEHNLYLLSQLGIEASKKDLVLRVTRESVKQATERLEQLGIMPGHMLVGMSPGATNGTLKQWLPERFARVAADLVNRYGAKVMIFGAAHESQLGASVVAEASASGIYNLAGLTSLEEAIALIAHCGLFVSNDAGLMHVAAALHVPVVAIFGPSDHRVTAPWCTKKVVVRKEGLPCSPCLKKDTCPYDHRCMKDINADEVLAACEQLLCASPLEPVDQRTRLIPVSETPLPVRTPL